MRVIKFTLRPTLATAVSDLEAPSPLISELLVLGGGLFSELGAGDFVDATTTLLFVSSSFARKS